MKSLLREQITKLAGQDSHRFHMPGHKGRGAFSAALDITEIEGADNLHDAHGVIREAQAAIAELYGSERSFILVGGSTAGNMAAVLAAGAPGVPMLVATNCHRSVFSALALGRIDARFVDPVANDDTGHADVMTPEIVKDALDKHPDVGGLVMTSPGYFGNVSDVRAIAALLHAKGKWLIVDEAHGAHLKFCDAPYAEDAVSAGADVVIHSAHKLLSSWNMGSLLHHRGTRIDADVLSRYLTMLQSSSPSYPIMISVEEGVIEAKERGAAHFGTIADRHQEVYAAQDPNANIKLYQPEDHYDYSKWLFLVADGTGRALANRLQRNYGIFCEIEYPEHLLAMTGMGTTQADLDALLMAISLSNYPLRKKEQQFKREGFDMPSDNRLNQAVPLWQAVLPQKTENLPLSECEGRVSAAFVMPYPPGVPALIPGDLISREMIDYIRDVINDGVTMVGLSDGLMPVLAK